MDEIKEYIIWGAKGHGKVVRNILDLQNYNLLALFDNNLSVSAPFSNIPLYYSTNGFESWFETLNFGEKVGFVPAIGGAHGKDRIAISNYLTSYNLVPLSVIHPHTCISPDVHFGAGVQIFAGACISIDVKIGDQTIINHMANVDHECVIGNGVHIAPSATLTGCIYVEDHCFIGAGATILPNLTIGEGSIVGAGAVVTKDVAPYSTVIGIPAKKN